MDVEQKVFVVDQLDPEVNAMLQAFYSRSDKSIAERLPDLGDTSEKIKAALGRYYLGYGHSSIAECGDTTLFVENVSMLAAKAIQDDPLYMGQETSTRYFDFEHRAYVSPFGDKYPAIAGVQADLIALYARLRPLVVEQIRAEHPYMGTLDDSEYKKWENATNARAFDVVRGFLPAGMTTQLSWKGSLRRISERLHTLYDHPCPEISGLASGINAQLCNRYPNSFTPVKTEEASTAYPFYDLDSPCTERGLKIGEVHTSFTRFREFNEQSYFHNFLIERDRKTTVPNFYNFYGQFMFEFLLDFGSFRDIQRHRNGLCPLPLLGGYTLDGRSNWFHPWYLEQLGPHRKEAEDILERVYSSIDDTLLEIQSTGSNMYEAHALMQYYYPMGTVVPVTVQYGLAETIYVSELRTSKTVHPTLREVAHGIAKSVKEAYPEIALHIDRAPDGFVLRRGAQTIFERSTDSVEEHA